jgi:MFS family permease
VQRPPIPAVIRDLYRDPRDARTLLIAALCLAAAGLDPRVYNPGLASVQAAVRTRPELEQALMIAAAIGALLLLVGGVLGDTDGRRRIQLTALATLTVTSASGLVITEGPLFLVSRLIGLGAASIILPVTLAGVAVTYQGIPRATAIGFAYAAYGGATAAGPVLLTLLGPTGPRWPAFLVSMIVAGAAFVVARRGWPDLPNPSRRQRRRVMATALWAAGIIATCIGLVGFGSGIIDPFRIAFVVGGLVVLGVAGVIERGVTDDDAVRVERRPVAMALFVGFVIAFAQAAPMLQLPLFFQLINGYGPIAAVVATAPFIVALIVTGPIVGLLLRRVGPRPLITVGVAGVGLGNILLALALAPSAPYLPFVLPLVLIGAGFVIATTVRTAIIFASVPRGLPATAAALNEASVALGTRAGLVTATLLIATISVDTYRASLTGQDVGTIDTAVAGFREVLIAIGTPGYGALVEGIERANLVAYAAAYTDAVRVTFGVTGVVTLVAAVVTWVLVGRRDPLETVWEHRDEREQAAATVVEPAGRG